jgi:hypothetical protein
MRSVLSWPSYAAGFVIGLWPAGLLAGGLDFYRLRGLLAIGFALGVAAASRPSRFHWSACVGSGLLAALALHLLAVGAEWRFIGFSFEKALPFIGCALAGVSLRFVVDRLRSTAPAVNND